jgi:hypothetical protein
MKRLPAPEVGAKFGFLELLEELPTERGIRWCKVRCECGAEKSVRFANLRTGSIKSCGCRHSDGGKLKRKVPEPGQRFGNWTFIGGEVSVSASMRGDFKCVCGTQKTLQISSVVTGKSKSCGCSVEYAVKHGKAGTYVHLLWKRLKRRCCNSDSSDYRDYGGRGIIVYPEWVDDFSAFDAYISEVLGPRPSNEHSLDRIDNDSGYIPGNLRWADHVQQANNRRNTRRVNFNGEVMTLKELSGLCNVSYDTLHHRIYVQEWDVARAMNTPTR